MKKIVIKNEHITLLKHLAFQKTPFDSTFFFVDNEEPYVTIEGCEFYQIEVAKYLGWKIAVDDGEEKLTEEQFNEATVLNEEMYTVVHLVCKFNGIEAGQEYVFDNDVWRLIEA